MFLAAEKMVSTPSQLEEKNVMTNMVVLEMSTLQERLMTKSTWLEKVMPMPSQLVIVMTKSTRSTRLKVMKLY